MEIVEWRWVSKDGWRSTWWNLHEHSNPCIEFFKARARDNFNFFDWRQEHKLANGQLVIVRAK